MLLDVVTIGNSSSEELLVNPKSTKKADDKIIRLQNKIKNSVQTVIFTLANVFPSMNFYQATGFICR